MSNPTWQSEAAQLVLNDSQENNRSYASDGDIEWISTDREIDAAARHG